MILTKFDVFFCTKNAASFSGFLGLKKQLGHYQQKHVLG